MNCWKTISITKQYGSHRLFIMSSITILLTFIFLYVPATYLFHYTTLDDNYFYMFVLGIFLLYPVHKLLHYLPICFFHKQIKKKIRVTNWHIPVIEVKIKDPIEKKYFLFALLTPFLFVNSLLFLACFFIPTYLHYLTILFSIHTGICFTDFLGLKNVFFAPKHSFIEENEDGFEILVHKVIHY